MTKLVRAFLLVMVLFNWMGPATYADAQTKNAMEQMDSILSDYVNETINNRELIESDVRFSASNVLNPKKNVKENIDDQIKVAVYTFKNQNAKEPMYDTFIDYSFVEPMKVKGNDLFLVEVSELLRPVSPVNSMMLTKTQPHDPWELSGKPTAIMKSLQSFTLEGDQLINSDEYTRIIIYFSSYANEQFRGAAVPEYELQYVHDPSAYISFTRLQLVIFSLIVAVLLYVAIKRKGFRKGRWHVTE